MGIVEFSTRRRVTVAMATVTLVLFGLIAAFGLKVNLLPDLSYPTLTVRTEYTGAAPAEIETLISEPVEEAVGVVKNLRKLRSVSRTGQSDVVLEFAWGTDMDQASLEVRDKLEVLNLPLEAEQPVLLRFNPSTEPIMRLVLAGTGELSGSEEAELMRLRRYAEDELKKRLEPVAGVAAVKVAGGLEDEVQVLIDQGKLAQLNLSVGAVIDRLRLENVNVSGGRIEEGSQRYLVRTVNQFTDLEQMRALLVANVDGVPIHLRDVATVQQGYKEREAIIRLGGREAVELAVYKEGDANTVAVAEAVKAALERLRADLPPGSALTTIEDQSIFIKAALAEVRHEAVMGGLFAILLIFFFLRDGWSTLVIGLSLPVSIIATFFFMAQFGLDLNVMSLAGLALATGMVVDDSIVVLESIAKARERGLGILEAAVTGTREVAMAVTASTLTTVAVFLPLVFVEGVAGQLFKDQALTVAIALVISLAVSLTLIPMLSSMKARAPMAFDPETDTGRPIWREVVALWADLLRLPLRRVRAAFARSLPKGVLTSLAAVALLPIWLFCLAVVLLVLPFAFLLPWLVMAFGWLLASNGRGLSLVIGTALRAVGRVVLKPYDWAESAYRRLLPKALDRPLPVLVFAALAFVLALLMARSLGTDLIPQFAQDRFEMTAKLPPGTQLRETDALVKAIQQAHGKDDGVQALYGVSGTGTRLDANPTESGENIAKLTVVMGQGFGPSAEARQTERMRETMASYPDVQVKFGRPQVFSFSTPLEIELRGHDLASLERAGRQLAAMLESDPGFADVKSTVEQGFPEIQIRFDQERAAQLGLTTREIADQVVRKVRGEVATRYSFRDRKIDVLVRAREQDRASVEDIRRIIVNPASDRPVTLAAVADVVATTGPSEIHRVDQVRVAVMSANLRDLDLGTAVQRVRAMVAENPLGADIRMHIGGQGEELDASIRSLLFAFGLAVFLVYLVMASQFESLLHPFVIMFTIPLAIVGAVLALWLKGSPISVVVFIGLILLVGIVVKNAIILIDKVNQLREEGVPKREALLDGAYSRLRPIIMTTATTLFGFAPLAFFGGEGAEVRAPMAITVIGGLAVSTLLTLVVIPVVYQILDRSSDAVFRERRERARALLRLRNQPVEDVP
ncbi:efflux RND transporter permease subunit [Arenimonas fontis]|uniref:Efflux RND transporter permease subunit n=1 Tax=Arenimonas fontis TaxID=2608255 RepID=A0A5B2ZDA6_9GAMM|nr:efflux RND transporter permease subunit [Arenimonas fontis]KAA2286009.1 efflux RND transporter permease subunit [Arenimonas fontis]